jgi:hypothetical protein
MNTVSGALVTAGSTDVTQLLVTDKPRQSEILTFYIKIVSGTVKFGIGTVSGSAHGWTSTDGNIVFECKHDELYFDAASAVDTFVVI